MSNPSKSHPTIALQRSLYLAATYTGARAVFNQMRHACLPKLQASAIDGRRLAVNGVEMTVRVHSRVTPDDLPRDRRAGMISITLASPSRFRRLYGLLCATSHFGCGHLEIAFYEEADTVVVHGVRDILKANVCRLGPRMNQRVSGLVLLMDEVDVLKGVAQIIQTLGLKVACAAPSGCVSLSVNRSLLHPTTRDASIEALRRRYIRLWAKVSLSQVPIPVLSADQGRAAPHIGTRLALAVAAIHPATTLVLFYTLAMHMHGSLGGWPAVIGNQGFSESLNTHAELAQLAFASLLLSCLAIGFCAPVVIGLSAFVPRLKRGVGYLGIYVVLGIMSLVATQLAPGPFLYWWWD